jgi:hypothetical protein
VELKACGTLSTWVSLGPLDSLKPQAEGNKPLRTVQEEINHPNSEIINEKSMDFQADTWAGILALRAV